ncbi:MAG: DNA polymerase ligase N-terminal domain-containing protein, partial [Myxococcota bacterium]
MGATEDRLAEYRDKRDPGLTNEPFPATVNKPTGGRGRFVVHHHAASRTHYDLRLECDGVLLSFAVPKGPSLHPGQKRLAVRTEDHPLEYLTFEDVIPEGSYGAGAMIVWDLGLVRHLEAPVERALAEGKLDFVLEGRKLRGRFALIHTGKRKPQSQAQWLLIKKQDEAARTAEEPEIVDQERQSVLSGLSVEQRKDAAALVLRLGNEALEAGASRGPVHAANLKPMLCAARGARLDDRARLYELKLDGVRILADCSRSGSVLRYRSGRDATEAYPDVVLALDRLSAPRALLDGEIVAFDETGRPNFQRLGRRIGVERARDVARLTIEVPVVFMAFDILALGEVDLRPLPLHRRKAILAQLVPGKGIVRTLAHLVGDGTPLMAFCDAHELEGVV